MRGTNKKFRWVYVMVFFIFMTLHHIDVVLLGPVASQILNSFAINQQVMDSLTLLGIFLAGICFLVWGYLYDSYSRRRLLALSGLLWGAISWLIGLAPTYTTFAVSYVASASANTGYSGIYSLVSDIFSPRQRGKITGLLLATQTIAFLLATILIEILDIGNYWRVTILLAGSMGFLMAFVVLWVIRDPKRGQSDPALSEMEIKGNYIFDKDIAKKMIKNPAMILLWGAGFFAIIPWTVISQKMFPYLTVLRGLSQIDVYLIMLPALMALTLGYPIGGMLGDLLFIYKRRGRIIISIAGIVLATLCLYLSFSVTDLRGLDFLTLLTFSGLFMALEQPNLFATLFDITLPEIRSSAIAVFMVFQLAGMTVGSAMMDYFAAKIGLGSAILWVSTGSWGVSLLFLIGLLFLLPEEIERLRKHLAYRSQLEARFDAE